MGVSARAPKIKEPPVDAHGVAVFSTIRRRARSVALNGTALQQVWRSVRPILHGASAITISAPFSAMPAVGVLVLPEVMVGMIEASITRRPARP